MSSRACLQRGRESFLGAVLLSLAFVVLLQPRPAAAQLSTSDPVGFFTNLSSRLLQAEFGLSLNQIQVYPTNQYTPAVHRLLQVTANLWETQTTNETGLPTVFRPRFSVINDAVYISSYVLVTNDSELAGLPLLDLTASANAASLIPPDGNALVFGVPLVIGARKGLPNFNEFAMESVFVLTRKLELRKSSPGGGDKINQTNQFFTLSATVPMAVEFWNSYASNYLRPVTVFVTNRCSFGLTNDLGVNVGTTFVFGAAFSTNDWPRFNSVQIDSFMVAMRTNVSFLPLVGYLPSGGAAGFVSATNVGLYDTSQELILPRWGLTITNRIHARIVDQATGQVIDYVLLGEMISHRNLTEEISNPTTASDPFERLWATNTLASGQLSGKLGMIQQINISRGANAGVDLSNGRWALFGTFTPNNVNSAVAAFNTFFQPGNTNLSVTVPFTPAIVFSMPMVWQVNDPLVHYLPGELFDVEESVQIWKIAPPTMVISANALPNIGRLNKRYRPWATDPNATDYDPDAFNPTIKDPLVRSSDNWNFPTNTPLVIETLGRVHRGTPWQTLYLKSSDLGLSNVVASPAEWAGNIDVASKWATWTGNSMLEEGYYTRPVRDWSLVALIASLINTNDARQFLSVNDQNPDNWRASFDGMTVLTNTRPNNLGAPAQFETLTMTSNSPQAMLLAEAIALARSNQPGQVFWSLDGLFATPELTTISPWLNYSGAYQLQRGITDEAYEKIPSQLLSRIRADSVGSVWPSGATWQIQFTGFDNYPYAVESSTNLVNWTSVSTNYPTNGVFTHIVDSAGGEKRFYRSVLLP